LRKISTPSEKAFLEETPRKPGPIALYVKDEHHPVARNVGKQSLKAVRNGSELKEAERAFLLRTLYSGFVSLVFSAIAYAILGPLGALGIIAQVAVFQRRLFRDLDTLLIKMERS